MNATKQQILINILEQMRALPHDDPADAHIGADDLLVEVIRVVAHPDVELLIEEILDAYESIPKWYA